MLPIKYKPMQATNLLELYPAAPHGEQADSSLHKNSPSSPAWTGGAYKNQFALEWVLYTIYLFS